MAMNQRGAKKSAKSACRFHYGTGNGLKIRRADELYYF
jgi:hypothetical protein